LGPPPFFSEPPGSPPCFLEPPPSPTLETATFPFLGSNKFPRSPYFPIFPFFLFQRRSQPSFSLGMTPSRTRLGPPLPPPLLNNRFVFVLLGWETMSTLPPLPSLPFQAETQSRFPRPPPTPTPPQKGLFLLVFSPLVCLIPFTCSSLSSCPARADVRSALRLRFGPFFSFYPNNTFWVEMIATSLLLGLISLYGFFSPLFA